MKKKVMVVGAGSGQVPIINCCKRHGLFTIVISPYGPYPGIDIADRHIDEDIYNVEELVEIGRTEGIDYVISDQSDFAVPIVAYIAEKLNLPGNSYKTASTYTFKSKFRKFAADNNIPVPKYCVLDNNNSDISALRFPLVVKPADSQGSRGISKIDSIDEFDIAVAEARKYSKYDKVVVEEFFRGKEVVCEGFVLNGIYYNVAFGDRCYFNLKDLFIPSKTVFPSNIDTRIKNKIIANEQKIASLLKPSFGIVHSEYLVNGDGEYIVIESALRGGGVYIASHLIPLTTGVDLTEALFEAMTGNTENCTERLNVNQDKAAEYLCFYLKEGIVTSLPDLKEFNKMPNVYLAELGNLQINDRIEKFEHKGMRKGPFIIGASSLDDVNDTEMQIKQNLLIGVDNVNGIIWD